MNPRAASATASELSTHPCDGCGTQTPEIVCSSCWGTTEDPRWCRDCDGVCEQRETCSPNRSDSRAVRQSARRTPHVTLHARGVTSTDGRPGGVSVAVHDGPVVDVANAVLRAIGYPVSMETVRTFDGSLREVRAFVTIDGLEMWHVFTTPGEQWPMAELR